MTSRPRRRASGTRPCGGAADAGSGPPARWSGARPLTDDVLIVGGGPAGLYAAQLLAARGLAVRLVEEHDQIGEPAHCTGILGAEALALPGVPRDAIVGWPTTARFHSPGGFHFAYTGTEGEVCMVDRAAFDRGLAAAAVTAGARITTGLRAANLRVERRWVEVDAMSTAGAPAVLRARVCLLATGANYRFQRALGWGLPRLLTSSAQTEVTATPDGALDVFFRSDTSSTGFAWLAPFGQGHEGRAKIGVMAPRHPRRVLASLLDDLARGGRAVGAGGRVVSRVLPLAPLARTHGERLLAIGDAAGLVKPTTGGGIYYSLLSARWAADTVSVAFERGDFSSPVMGRYEGAWRAHLARELTVGMWFRRLAARLTPADIDVLTQVTVTQGVMSTIRASASFDWHSHMILRVLRHPRVLQIMIPRLLSRAGRRPGLAAECVVAR